MNSEEKLKRFMDKANAIHKFKYDYSKFIYINNVENGIIVCPEHGDFSQTPASHANQGSGCPHCAYENSFSNTDLFVKQVNIIHNYKYVYSKTIYTYSLKQVVVICPTHGDFAIIANDHLNGRGCGKCGKDSQRSNTQEFIEKANKVHKNKYGYSKVDYINNNTDIVINCSIHGDFLQRPGNHLQGQGCEECSMENKRISFDIFVERANNVHKNKYTYIRLEYPEDDRGIAVIICPKHKEFKQRIYSHLDGFGCSKCSKIISDPETEWLDSLSIPKEYRQKHMKIDDKRFKFDAYDPTTNTVYEYLGDFWHGNPATQKLDNINPRNHISYGKLYDIWLEKERIIKSAGYNLITIWESEWRATHKRKQNKE